MGVQFSVRDKKKWMRKEIEISPTVRRMPSTAFAMPVTMEVRICYCTCAVYMKEKER